MPSTSPPTTVSSDSPLTAELELAWQLADIADEISMGRFLANDLQVDTKPDLSPVTEADRAVDKHFAQPSPKRSRPIPWRARSMADCKAARSRRAVVDHRPHRRNEELRPRGAGVGDVDWPRH